jgi:hypothetical protein
MGSTTLGDIGWVLIPLMTPPDIAGARGSNGCAMGSDRN